MGSSDNVILRSVIIDGPNFLHKAHEGIKGNSMKVDASHILLLVNAMLQIKHNVIVILKEYYMDEGNTKNSYILEELKEAGLIIVLDDSVDDDLEILRFADDYGSFVISNDQYRQEEYQQFSEVRDRVIDFECSSPPDMSKKAFEKPYAKFELIGQIELNEKYREASICPESDSDFVVVRDNFNDFIKNHRERLLLTCEVLADYLHHNRCLTESIEPPKLDYYDDAIGRDDLIFKVFKSMYSRNSFEL